MYWLIGQSGPIWQKKKQWTDENRPDLYLKYVA